MTENNNPLLQKFDLAPFSNIKNEHFLPAFKFLIDETKKEIEEITSNKELPSFENTIDTVIQLNEVNELIIYRCIQELVNNAVKHSGANEIKIIFSQSAYLFKVLIIDNGIGFEPSNSQNNGMGLMNIAERITLINGELDIQSIINKGSQITLSVPITN